MNPRHTIIQIALCALTGCGIEEAIRKNDDRYATPGAQDAPLTGIYSKYSFRLMGRHQVSHDWVNTAACSYRARELPDLSSGRRSNTYQVPDLYEAGDKTWQASNAGLSPMDFDPWVRSVKWVSREKGKEGDVREVGLKPVCVEGWWSTSHYLALYLRRTSVPEYEAAFLKGQWKAKWATRQLNGVTWRIAQIAPNELQPNGPNASGGPYQVWLTALGDSGYVMSFLMGASKESLDHPKAHAEVERVFMHLVNSLKVERLSP